MHAGKWKLNQARALALAIAVLACCAPVRAATRYQVLYQLPSPDLGVVPGVTVDKEGSVYAATGNGGTGKDCGEYGCGLIFELSPQPGGKWAYSLVHDFTGTWDAASPNGNLVVDASGNLGARAAAGAHGEGARCSNSRRAPAGGH